MSLKVTVLGCSGIYSAPGGACSGYLIDSSSIDSNSTDNDAAIVWLDAGPGTLPNLQLHHQLQKVDAMVLSHEHPDHWLELPVIYNAWKYCLGKDVAPLAVYGTAGTKALAENLIGESLSPVLDFQVIADGDEIKIGNQKWLFSETDHPVETLAARISLNGSSVAYSADTGPKWNPTEIISGVDLFLCEATFPTELEGEIPVHLSARQAGEMAAQGKAKRLAITHSMPTQNSDELAQEATQAFGMPVEQAEINATYTI